VSSVGTMTSTVGAFEARIRLSALLRRVQAGEQITITKHGRAVARLVPVTESVNARDWKGFWSRVDSRLVPLSPGSSIKADIAVGRR
jgi:prevent-host-death family protein